MAAHAPARQVLAVRRVREEPAVHEAEKGPVPSLRRHGLGDKESVMSKPKVPSTISDKQRAALARRAREPAGGPFGKKAIAQRKASERQRGKARWS